MYTDMELWAEIRRRVLTGEISKRQACREYEIHWQTLKKILAHEEPPGFRASGPPGQAHAGAVPADHPPDPGGRPARPRRSSGTRPSGSSSGCGTSTGTPAAPASSGRRWPTGEQGRAEVFVPLAHPPGEAQVDFGQAEVVVAGERVTAAFFVMTLPHSDAFFVRAFPKECTETFQDGHVRAFAYFGGVPTRISYDNSKIAVAAIVGQRGRTPTREFLRLASHFLFAYRFCRVRRPNEKGHVEAMVGFARRNFLVPVPEADSWEALNAELAHRCRADLGRQLRGKAEPEGRAAGRRAGLAAPAARRTGSRRGGWSWPRPTRCRWSGSTANDYSVPTAYAHQPITVVGGLDEVRLVCRDQLVARHRRHWGKEHVTFDPVHYLALLERKPGAFDYARPLAGWDLPEEFAVLRRRFEAAWGRGRACGTSSRCCGCWRGARSTTWRRPSAGRWRSGRPRPTPSGCSWSDRGRRPSPLFRLDGRPHLAGVSVPRPDLTAYRALRDRGWVMKKTETTSTVLLKHHLKALRLPTVLAECEKVAQRCATDNVDHLGYLLQLTELELLDRERRAAERRLKAARFPTLKTLEDFDFAAQPSLNKVLVAELMRCEFLDRRESVILLGQPGHRQDARGHGVGRRGVPAGQAGAVLAGDRVGHPVAGGPRGAGAAAAEGPTGPAGLARAGRTRVCADEQGRGGAAVRRDQHGVRADQRDRDDEPAVRAVDRGARERAAGRARRWTG